MLEIIMLIAGCVFMYRCAEAEDMSGILWAIGTFALCFGIAALLPGLPFLRIIIGLVVAFCAMIGWNIYRDR